MVNYVAVIPSIYPPYTNECLATSKLDNVVVVDNTVRNRGVAASWNIGIREMYNQGADWTVIISAAVRFGEPGGLDLVDAMENNPDALCVEADKCGTLVCGHKNQRFGWHLMAVHRQALDDAGIFDENFWPGYVEETDFVYRLKLIHGDEGLNWNSPDLTSPSPAPRWPRVPVDATLAWIGHGVDKAMVDIRNQGQDAYFARKWGGRVSAPVWKHPFNNPNNPVNYWPVPSPRDELNWKRQR